MIFKAYLATHFFNEAGLEWTKNLARQIRDNSNGRINLYVPHENSSINDKKNNDEEITDIKIVEEDNKYLEEANILFACIDGVEIDAGVSSEIGYFAGLIRSEKKYTVAPKPRIIVGIYTDMRQYGTGDNHFYINLYTKGLINKYGVIFESTKELIEELPMIIKELENQ